MPFYVVSWTLPTQRGHRPRMPPIPSAAQSAKEAELQRVAQFRNSFAISVAPLLASVFASSTISLVPSAIAQSGIDPGTYVGT